jgi:hypothetical protein
MEEGKPKKVKDEDGACGGTIHFVVGIHRLLATIG